MSNSSWLKQARISEHLDGSVVEHLPLAQVMILGVLGQSPMLGSLLSGESASPSSCAHPLS